MQQRPLGCTGVAVSRACLGTMTFGLQCDEAASFGILDAAAEAGVTFLDTADMYPLGGDVTTAGRTEVIVGKWLSGRRDQFIVATKCGGQVGGRPWHQGMSRKHILDAIDASLRRLSTDYVDVYQLHYYDAGTRLDDALEALDQVVRSGKARYVGVSNWPAYKLARAIGRTEVKGLVRIDSVQPRYSLLFRQAERDLVPLCSEESIGFLPYNVLAGGLLTGKHDRGAPPRAGGRFTLQRAGQNYQARYWHEPEFDTIEQLRELAGDAGMSMTALSVAWVLANPVVTSVIIGASRPQQLADTLAAVDVRMDPALKQRLDDVTARWRKGDATR
jgi:1-deoxyxylulose-5-phosphate synthase